jgi:hypothetical protein
MSNTPTLSDKSLEELNAAIDDYRTQLVDAATDHAIAITQERKAVMSLETLKREQALALRTAERILDQARSDSNNASDAVKGIYTYLQILEIEVATRNPLYALKEG